MPLLLGEFLRAQRTGGDDVGNHRHGSPGQSRHQWFRRVAIGRDDHLAATHRAVRGAQPVAISFPMPVGDGARSMTFGAVAGGRAGEPTHQRQRIETKAGTHVQGPELLARIVDRGGEFLAPDGAGRNSETGAECARVIAQLGQPARKVGNFVQAITLRRKIDGLGFAEFAYQFDGLQLTAHEFQCRGLAVALAHLFQRQRGRVQAAESPVASRGTPAGLAGLEHPHAERMVAREVQCRRQSGEAATDDRDIALHVLAERWRFFGGCAHSLPAAGSRGVEVVHRGVVKGHGSIPGAWREGTMVTGRLACGTKSGRIALVWLEARSGNNHMRVGYWAAGMLFL